MLRHRMASEISRATGMRYVDVRRVMRLFLNLGIDVLNAEGGLELRNFGVFTVKKRKARRARNPRTGETIMVPAKRVVTFKAGKGMKEEIR